MRPFRVVNLHSLVNHSPYLFQIIRAVQQEFRLENAVHPLSQRILITVVAICYRTLYAIPLMG
ncbi:hypothetical protein WH50_16590 [Pokkaliibacter plantistimulans]|uniref:Uncharacterized protein n=1 Tax=Pokkaliibacter plantistimulans TaxID=1635171 RepID=A0ABX5LXC4_9GAMM|nr:hypothetical protein WH50_16590 [Pokkaliibacter plantistimulans]